MTFVLSNLDVILDLLAETGIFFIICNMIYDIIIYCLCWY